MVTRRIRPARYAVSVRHVRSAPVRHEVKAQSYMWLVDVDRVDEPGIARSIRASDYQGEGGSLREKTERFLGEYGINLGGGRITMLTNPRTFGYQFNPLTVFWCHNLDGELAAVVAEVHNTYGEDHRYLLRPDENAQAEVGKQFYVSPFYPVDGYYRMRIPEPGKRLSLSITLHREGDPPFVASLHGRRVGFWKLTALRHPFESIRIRALIQWHGIRLYLRGLPVIARQSQDKSSRREPVEVTVSRSVSDRLNELVTQVTGVPLPVRLRAWDGSESGPGTGPTVVLRNRRSLRHLLAHPNELGLARAYVSGDLDVEGDLAEGLRQVWQVSSAGGSAHAATSLRTRLSAVVSLARLGVIGAIPAAPASEARLHGSLHSRRRDRDAIAHHYDLSNDFYRLILDESMAYSCAYFTDWAQPLAQAQRDKLDLICQKLGLAQGMSLLDVGCGWGSLIVHAAQHYGVRATGITLSAQQRDFIAKRIAEAGVADLVTVRLLDYREIDADETYDAVSSIEMGEHVGQENYAIYAATLHDHLRPGGRLLLQQMSRKQGSAPGGGAFIESYIAPDMHMRPLPETLEFLENAGFEIRDVHALREHYVHTVYAWINTFENNYEQAVRLVGEEQARVWRLYLAGGALAFEQARMGVDQILAVRADAEGAAGMPVRRMY